MIVRLFSPDSDFYLVKEWIRDARLHALWCANRMPFPLTRSAFDAFMLEEAKQYGNQQYAAVSDDGITVGYYCCSVDAASGDAMLKFVVVSPEMRGHGYGREMIRLAVRKIFTETNAQLIRLNVFSVNTPAIRCYLHAGFTVESDIEGAFPFGEETWGRTQMAIRRAAVLAETVD